MSRKKTRIQGTAAISASGPNDNPVRTPAQSPARTVISGNSSKRPGKSAPPPLATLRISGRWVLFALTGMIAAAVFCTWSALCLLFWQGSWQLLYRPSAAIGRTPAAAGLAFDPISFATTGSGLPRLNGWWIPAAPQAPMARYTVLFLHSQDGNLGNTVDRLAELHAAGVNVFAFDYRGYGQSQFARPSEKHWIEDSGWALQYLTATRHIAPATVVLCGSGLGADLALEVAAARPQLAGVVLDSPLENATDAIFQDGRARLVPARLLVRDRYDLTAPASALRIPSLWFLPSTSFGKDRASPENSEVFQKVPSSKTLVWLPPSKMGKSNFANGLTRWLDDLQTR
jgi:hypothetical protein